MLTALAWIRRPHLDRLPQTNGQGYYVEEGGPLCFGGAVKSLAGQEVPLAHSPNLPSQM